MTMAQHTPGPWEVFTTVDEPQSGNFHSAIYGPVGDYDGLFVALANQNGNYGGDALLIAAAPELLEVLKAFVAETVEYATINKLGDPEKQHNVKWARQVIAKAEGRS
jgi:hypothetical protein